MHLLIPLLNSSEKFLSIGMLSGLLQQIQFLNFLLLLESSNFTTGKIVSVVFFEVTGLFPSLPKKCLSDTEVWITIACLSVVLSSKSAVPWKIQLVFLQTQSPISFPQNGSYKAEGFFFVCVVPFCYTIFKIHVHSGHSFIKLIFVTASSSMLLSKIGFLKYNIYSYHLVSLPWLRLRHLQFYLPMFCTINANVNIVKKADTILYYGWLGVIMKIVDPRRGFVYYCLDPGSTT